MNDQLVGLEHDAGTPLTVTLLPAVADTSAPPEPVELAISRILRLLPGKRLVGVAHWQNRAVIIKLFYHRRRWSRHLQRELAGYALTEQCVLPVPQVLASGNLAGHKGGYLISEYLSEGVGLDSLVDEHAMDLDTHVRQALGLIARCHQQGLWQQDIHLGNFMALDGTMYLLDSAEFKSENPGMLLSEAQRLSNLALFFAQFSVYRDPRVRVMVEAYNSELPGNGAIADITNLQALIRQARERRLDKYQSKLFRETSAFHVEHRRDRRLLCNRKIMSEEFRDFLQNPDSYLEQGTLLKGGNTTTVGQVAVGGTDYVLKRYNIKNRLHGLRRMLRASRASRSWRSGLVLEMLGVTTARPLLMLEKRQAWYLRRESYILYELVKGQTVPEVLGSAGLSPQVRDRIFESFGQFLEVLRRYMISHGDLKASNFIYANDELVLLDLDATTRHSLRLTFRRAFRKDLERFLKNFSEDSGLHHLRGQARELVRSLSD
ncbi:MAG: lipopolysaccharide kinase InaA family protein [Gammaproteobacteria bacterium]